MTDRTTNETNELNRRRFVQWAGVGAAGASVGLSGCLGDDDTDDETTPDGNGESAPDDDGMQEGGTLVWGHSEVTQNLDPHQTATASTGRFLRSIYESLVGLSQDLELTKSADGPSPGLAEDWTVSDDQLTYEFSLREGVQFHDGSTLTSADVKYTYERMADPDTAAIMGFVMNPIDTIETPDDSTVVIELEEVFQPFLRQLAFSGTAIVPEDSGDGLGEQPIGTGPFQFDYRQQGNDARLEAFDDYWGEGPYLDAVEEKTVTDPDSRLTGIETGEYNVINDIPLNRIDDIVDDSNLQTEQWTPLSWAFFNMNNAEEPFDDVNMRKAMDFAIDKEELVDGALFGNGETTATPSFPDSAFRNNDLEPRPQDFDRARELIDESPYDPEAYELEFKVTTNYPWHIDAAVIMREYFQELGFEVELQRLQWGDWLEEVFQNQDFRITMVNFFTFWEPDYLYHSVWGSEGAFNTRNYASDRFDEAVANARVAAGREEAIEYYQEAQAVLHEEVPDVMLWFRDGTLAAEPTVGGLDTMLSPDNSQLNFKKVWLDE
ncbi:MAG: ABC transporter substrate-binding protein [Halobacteriota archaeon]